MFPKLKAVYSRYRVHVYLCLCAWKKVDKMQEDIAFIFYPNIPQLNFSLHQLSLDFLPKKWCMEKKILLSSAEYQTMLALFLEEKKIISFSNCFF